MKETDKLVDAMALVSHVLLGVKLRVWEHPYSKDRVLSQLYSAWLEEHLIEADGEFTPKGRELMRSADFLQYELNVAQSQSYESYPPTDKDNYVMLRRALGETFMYDIRPMFVDVATEYIKEGYKVLDYAGGDGQYLSSLKYMIPNLKLWLADKHDQVKDKDINVTKVDVIFNRVWYHKYVSHFNAILANEILHCLDDKDIVSALDDIKYMLAKGGVLIVGEQIPTTRMNVRMAAYAKGKMYRQVDMKRRVLESGDFRLIGASSSSSHYFLIFEVV